MSAAVQPDVCNPEPSTKGKKLSEVDKTKNDAYGRASDVGRQLAYAGIATVWLLRDDAAARPLSNILLLALVFLSAALIVDLMQYVHCSRIWKKFYNEQFDIHGSDEALVDIPKSLTASMYNFFWAKIWLLGPGYVFLLAGAIVKLRIF
ncbi:hypothetical protein [Lysobacter sp. M2-1]|uniref:hypothetical protein n=1 Tax=Lysobacter sp. M2-1 TaxID=2916839 RepID=UPI001F57E761|nr:hypothetical protein [Lysobacter sp. M2-1]